MIKYSPDSIASAADASRHVGAVDVTPRPIVTANVSNTDDNAVAMPAHRQSSATIAGSAARCPFAPLAICFPSTSPWY